MSDTIAPPRDDEPDRDPNESRRAYRRRTIPGFAELDRANLRNRRARKRRNR